MGTAPDLRAWISLSLIPGLGAASLRKLLREIGEPNRILSSSYTQLAAIVPPSIARCIAAGTQSAEIDTVTAWLEDSNNSIMTWADPDFPPSLLQIADPPPLLYIKGRRQLLASASLAVVGSRHATPQGLRDAESFSRSLSDSGLCIISGLAHGIDAAAHRGGLGGASSTLAVVGTGLNIVYPSANRDLAIAIAEQGALLSEFPLGTPAKAGHFPRRNRIISGLALGCLVIEAAPQSGSLITAKLAVDQGKDVFAIPGSIHSPLSKGPHRLIKQGAKLVETAQDVLEELGFLLPPSAPAEAISAADNDSAERLLTQLGFDPADIGSLADRCGLTSETVCAMLLPLELEGRVVVMPGGFYQRVF